MHTPKLLFFCAVIFCSRCQNFGRFWESPPEQKTNPSAPVTYWRIADTGQTLCYDDSTTATCTGNTGTHPRQDADFINTPRARSFTGPTQHALYTTDYTTVDNVTGLVWKTCAEGKAGSTCTGTASTHTISPDTATPACTALNSANSGAGYAGRTDWRLPKVAELQTLADYNGGVFAIDTTAFPNTTSTPYWSSTIHATNSSYAWFVSYADGAVNNTTITMLYLVRCVAGGPLMAAAFTDNGDGTVSDSSTGLVWQQCSNGQSGAGCATGTASTFSWSSALTTCNSLSLAGRSWRLPSANELMSLVDFTANNPAINLTYFPNSISDNYWTSTTLPTTPANARHVFFTEGMLHNLVKTSPRYLRCVASLP